MLVKAALAAAAMASGIAALDAPRSLGGLALFIAGGAAAYAVLFFGVLRGLDPEDRRLLRGVVGRG